MRAATMRHVIGAGLRSCEAVLSPQRDAASRAREAMRATSWCRLVYGVNAKTVPQPPK